MRARVRWSYAAHWEQTVDAEGATINALVRSARDTARQHPDDWESNAYETEIASNAQMRRASKVSAQVAREELPHTGKTREGARTKPRVEGAVDDTQHNGAKGVASSASRHRDHARSRSQGSTTAEPEVRHEHRSQASV